MYRHAWLSVAAVLLFGINPACADNRVALVIGNGAYQSAPHLTNPANDAADVAAALRRLGFDTTLATDQDRVGMDEVMIRFARAASTADVAMFYYSGHALQFNEINYLMPVDAKLTDEADLRRMTRVDGVVADLRHAKNLSILVLDSCRDNTLAEQLSRSRLASRGLSLPHGLAKINPPEDMIVAYATQAGQTANDGNSRNSPYASAFLKNIEAQDEIGTIFRHISADVYQSTHHAQLPELSLSLTGDFYLRGKVEISPSPSSSTVPRTLFGAPFVAAEVPFLCDKCRDEIQRLFKGQDRHSALVLSLDGWHYWSTQQRTALEARAKSLLQCLEANRLGCFVYAVDERIYWDEPPPPLPLEPWFKLDPETTRPLDFQKIGAIADGDRKRVEEFYRQLPGKALAVGPDWQWTMTRSGDNYHEAARVVLQRCAYITHAPCRVMALGDSLVVGQDLLNSVPRTIPAMPTQAAVSGPDYSLTGPEMRVADIPFVCDDCRYDIEKALANKPPHTAIVVSLYGGSFYSWGQGSAEIARTRALGNCLGARQTACMVFAVDGKLVWKENPPDLPPLAWFSHENDKPLNLSEIKVLSETARQTIQRIYSSSPGPKAIALGSGGIYGLGIGYGPKRPRGETEAARLALERCAFLVQARCRIIAVNENLVVDAKTLDQ